MGTIKIWFVLVLLTLVPLLGCASHPSEKPVCEEADWYEIGRKDGAQGAPSDRLKQHTKECSKTVSPEWETVYLNGRNAGLVEFCDPRNAYELGRSGGTYFYVCPSTNETQFLSSYRKGQSARNIEIQNQKLDQEIDVLSQRLLQAGNTYEQKQLSTQLDELKTQRGRNEKALSKMEN